MKQNKYSYYSIIVLVVSILSCVFAVAYSYMSNYSSEKANISVSIGGNATFSYTGSTSMNMAINVADLPGNQAANDYSSYIESDASNTTVALTIDNNELTSGMTCSYSIIYHPLSTVNKSSAATSADLKEFVVVGTSNDAENFEVEIKGTSDIVLSTQLITATAAQPAVSHTWNFKFRFYNLLMDQQLQPKTLQGRIYVKNNQCWSGNVPTLANYLIDEAPKSGVDNVTGSSWVLTSDHQGEYRYAGKNPNNYLSFNGELWRIIGVMPNMEYCTGTYGTATECNTTSTGSLVKIIRNENYISTPWDYKQTGVGSSYTVDGSNDWSDSQIMLMLNGPDYLTTAYDVDGNKLHTSYTITSNVVSGNGYRFYNAAHSYIDASSLKPYVPSSATTTSYNAVSQSQPKKMDSSALNYVATVKWSLYGLSLDDYHEDLISTFYNKERNISNSGSVYDASGIREKRPVYWYGKVGLIYPSDYGYATNGLGDDNPNYSRSRCLAIEMYNWDVGDNSNCASNSWILYQGVTSTIPTSGATQWTITPLSDLSGLVFRVSLSYFVDTSKPKNSNAIRPVVYLKTDTLFGGRGTGTWDDPYIIN